MSKDTEISYKEDYSHINIYRKIFGIWFFKERITREIAKHIINNINITKLNK